MDERRIHEIADLPECSPDRGGWGPKFDYVAFARAILREAGTAETRPMTNADVFEAWRTTEAARDDYGWTSCEWFQAGVRFAQKFYGITAASEGKSNG